MLKSIFIGMALCVLTLPAWAQQPERDPVLPDLAPREVEIRGALEIAFPSLRRQPLVGFNPPPRVPEVPADRRPYMAPYKQASADLPPSPLQRPEPPPVAAALGAAPLRGEFEAGAGRYFARLVRARLSVGTGETAAVYGRLDYHGSEGHAPFEDNPGLKNPYDALDGTFGVKNVGALVAFGVEADGFYESYFLYGTQTNISRPGFNVQPLREGRGGGGTLWLRSQGLLPAAFEARLRLGASQYDTGFFDPNTVVDPLFTRIERRADFDGRVEVPVQQNTAWLEAGLSSAGLDTESAFTPTVSSYDAGGGLRFRARRLDLSVGARAMGFTAEGQTPTGGDATAGYLSLQARLDAYPATGINVYAQNRPGLDPHPLAELYRTNPYLVDEPKIQPTVRVIDAEGGVRFFTGPVQLAGRAGYQDMPNYAYFEHVETQGLVRGLTAVNYAKARIVHVGGDVSVVLPSGLHATVGATYREGTLPDEGTDIPYFGALVGRAMLSYAFDRGRGLFQLTGTFEGARDRDRLATLRVPAFGMVDAALSYDLTPWIGLTVRADNLGPASQLTRWDHYPLTPATVTGSLRVRW